MRRLDLKLVLMALWQFDLQFIPEEIAPNVKDNFDRYVSDDGLETSTWWENHQPIASYRSLIGESFPLLDSWHTDLCQWGNSDDVLIEVWTHDGIVESIEARIDLRNAVSNSFQQLANVLALLSCHAVLMESRMIIPPIARELMLHASQSSAASFCRDPRGFLTNLSRLIDEEESKD